MQLQNQEKSDTDEGEVRIQIPNEHDELHPESRSASRNSRNSQTVVDRATPVSSRVSLEHNSLATSAVSSVVKITGETNRVDDSVTMTNPMTAMAS